MSFVTKIPLQENFAVRACCLGTAWKERKRLAFWAVVVVVVKRSAGLPYSDDPSFNPSEGSS